MKIQKELVKISKDLEKYVQTDPKAYASIPKKKVEHKKPACRSQLHLNKGKKSGTQTVLDMIKKSKTGIAAGTLIKKTGFEDKKFVTSSSKP